MEYEGITYKVREHNSSYMNMEHITQRPTLVTELCGGDQGYTYKTQGLSKSCLVWERGLHGNLLGGTLNMELLGE